VLALAALLLPLASHAQSGAGSAPPPRKPLPTTGVDFSGIDAFYRIADILARDEEPSDAQWEELQSAPGYRLVEIVRFGARRRIRIALKPSLAATRDSLIRRSPGQARTLRHLQDTYAQRDNILRLRDTLARTLRDTIAVAVARTERFLPAGTTKRFPAPFIGFAVFNEDGFATDSGVVVDPLTIKQHGAADLFSHEFNHSYVGMIDRSLTPAEIMAKKPLPTDLPVFVAVLHLRNEGLADQVDKPYPFAASDSAYAAQYNSEYARTPAVLRAFDSVLVALPNDATAAQRAQPLFWANGHPNGAYMARTVLQTFGTDSLLTVAYNPFTLMRLFNAAEQAKRQPPSLSPQGLAVLRDMEVRYIKP
jgi:hypothetical protein